MSFYFRPHPDSETQLHLWSSYAYASMRDTTSLCPQTLSGTVLSRACAHPHAAARRASARAKRPTATPHTPVRSSQSTHTHTDTTSLCELYSRALAPLPDIDDAPHSPHTPVAPPLRRAPLSCGRVGRRRTHARAHAHAHTHTLNNAHQRLALRHTLPGPSSRSHLHALTAHRALCPSTAIMATVGSCVRVPSCALCAQEGADAARGARERPQGSDTHSKTGRARHARRAQAPPTPHHASSASVAGAERPSLKMARPRRVGPETTRRRPASRRSSRAVPPRPTPQRAQRAQPCRPRAMAASTTR